MSENVQDETAGEPLPDSVPAVDVVAELSEAASAPAVSVPVSSKRWYVVHA